MDEFTGAWSPVTSPSSKPLVIQLVELSTTQEMFWISYQDSSLVTGWGVEEERGRVKLFETDIASDLSSLTDRADSTGHEVQCLRAGLDTLWVGTASGHILVYGVPFQREELQKLHLVTWLHPFSSRVVSLVLVPGPGPCRSEQCLMFSFGESIRRNALSTRSSDVLVIGDREEATKEPPVVREHALFTNHQLQSGPT